MRILTADIGGTNTRMAVVVREGRRYRIECERLYPSGACDDFTVIARDFLNNLSGRPARACFGIAGPVDGDNARLTNLPWQLSAATLCTDLGLDAVHLLNDLEALAWSLDILDENDLVTLLDGSRPAAGNRAVIAAGTGLGEAGLYWDGRAHHPFATEGGHADFSPADERGFRLQRFLAARFGHVSWERVVSGQGLAHLYEYLLQDSAAEAPAWFAGDDPAALISQRALEDRDSLCAEALRWFVRLYGAEAGNLALKHMTTGGLYIGGGIAPKILPALQDGGFVEAFLAKGRMRPLLEGMPVRVICNDAASMLGLARYGFEMARPST